MSLDPLSVGAPAPRFEIEGAGGHRLGVESLGGRHLVLAFLGRATGPLAEAAIAAMSAAELIDGKRAVACLISADPQDRAAGRLDFDPGRMGAIYDLDLSISRRYGAARPAEGGVAYSPLLVVLDPRLRVLKAAPLAAIDEVLAFVAALPPPSVFDGGLPAPVLIVPRIFEPELCAQLIQAFETGAPTESGFMRQFGDKTVQVKDERFKRRSDIILDDGELRVAVRERLSQRLVPEVASAFQFAATRIERYIVSRYDAEVGGFFKPHRDNTTTGTAHRKFAVTINLNAEDYDGGDLRFPEFGERVYRAPTGGAVVFSCSLMHEATPVTRGRRYAFLPFLYDEAGAKVREANLNTVVAAQQAEET